MIQQINEITKTLIDIAIEEGNKFRELNGREPTEAEAGRIAEMIERQFKLACVMVKS